jgi:NADPH:quinone reductase-like Zn-dependent oxidoreductase
MFVLVDRLLQELPHRRTPPRRDPTNDLLRQLRVRQAGFPLSDVPLQTIAGQVAAGRLKAKPSRVFRFEEIREAHRVMEAGEARGKMVVVVHG